MKPTDPLPTPKLHICKDHYKWYQGYHKMPWRTPLKFFLISDMQLKLRPLESRSWEECLRGLWARLGDKRTHWGSERHPQLLEGPSWVLFSAVLRRQNADQKGKLRTSKKGISSGEGTELSAVDMVQQRQAEEPAEGTAASRILLHAMTSNSPPSPWIPMAQSGKDPVWGIPASLLPSTSV